MSPTEQSLWDAALSLPPETRVELAEAIWASLPDEPLEAELDEDIQSAWISEAQRRMAEVEAGNVKLVPGDEVLKRLRARKRS
jgi:putative addiction module component (TIGR02574 family)